jgi:hypothetical protein
MKREDSNERIKPLPAKGSQVLRSVRYVRRKSDQERLGSGRSLLQGMRRCLFQSHDDQPGRHQERMGHPHLRKFRSRISPLNTRILNGQSPAYHLEQGVETTRMSGSVHSIPSGPPNPAPNSRFLIEIIGFGDVLITSKTSDQCKLSTLCQIPLYSGATWSDD